MTEAVEIPLATLLTALARLPPSLGRRPGLAATRDRALEALLEDLARERLHLPGPYPRLGTELRVPPPPRDERFRRHLMLAAGIVADPDVAPIVRRAVAAAGPRAPHPFRRLALVAEALASLVDPLAVLDEPVRGEELARRVATAFALRLSGESDAESTLRLGTVDVRSAQRTSQENEEARREREIAAAIAARAEGPGPLRLDGLHSEVAAPPPLGVSGAEGISGRREPGTERSQGFLVRLMRDHPSAPHPCGEEDDGLTPAFLERVVAFGERLRSAGRDPGVARHILRGAVCEAIERQRARASYYRRALAAAARGAGVEDLPRLPLTGREALAAAPAALVPQDEDLGPLVVARSAGTSGSPLLIPEHPVSLACAAPLLLETLRRRKLEVELGAELCGVMVVSARARPAVCALKALSGAGLARIEVTVDGAPGPTWRDPLDPARFIAAFAPQVLLGRPGPLEALARIVAGAGSSIPRPRPRAVVVSGAPLTGPARERIRAAFGAPVIEWYATAESGPVAYSCAMGEGLHILPPDLLVEGVEGGELAFTGGRNPFLPLIRYRPGDRAAVERGPCACGDAAPRIVGLARA